MNRISSRKNRRNFRKLVFRQEKAAYHPGYFKGTRQPTPKSNEERAMRILILKDCA